METIFNTKFSLDEELFSVTLELKFKDGNTQREYQGTFSDLGSAFEEAKYEAEQMEEDLEENGRIDDINELIVTID